MSIDALLRIVLPIMFLLMAGFIVRKVGANFRRGKLSLVMAILWDIFSIVPVGFAVIILMTQDGVVGFWIGAVIGIIAIVLITVVSIGTYRVIEAMRNQPPI